MKILEYGNPSNDKIILIHGFESPYQVWQDYIDFYKKDYCLIVPILTGHNVDDKEDFISFERCVKELESYYITKYGNKVYAIYGMSMGGIVASYIWQNQNIEITKLILESSPLLPFGKVLINILTKQYLSITHKVKIRDEKTAKIALTCALTGHLVLTTIHASNAKMALKRIMNLGIQSTDLQDVLIGSLSQKLIYDKDNQDVIVIAELLDRNQIKHYLSKDYIEYDDFLIQIQKLIDQGVSKSIFKETLYE